MNDFTIDQKRVIDEYVNRMSSGKVRFENIMEDAEQDSKFMMDLVGFIIKEVADRNELRFKQVVANGGKHVDFVSQVLVNSSYITLLTEMLMHDWNRIMAKALNDYKMDEMKKKL